MNEKNSPEVPGGRRPIYSLRNLSQFGDLGDRCCFNERKRTSDNRIWHADRLLSFNQSDISPYGKRKEVKAYKTSECRVTRNKRNRVNIEFDYRIYLVLKRSEM